jgi:hypothetical protein
VSYRHATDRDDYRDLASGAVLHSAPGFPAFPVRLASEMFQRALELRGAPERPETVWDPCCGSGYLLTVLAILHRPRIGEVLATDIEQDALRLAERNLRLLTGAGLVARAAHLDEHAARFGRASHAEAAVAAARIGRTLATGGGDVPHAVRQADVFDPERLRRALDGLRPGVVVTDVPYGERTDWRGPGAAAGVTGMLRALGSVLPDESVVALAVRGRKVPLGDGLRPDASFRIGTRAVALLTGKRLHEAHAR